MNLGDGGMVDDEVIKALEELIIIMLAMASFVLRDFEVIIVFYLLYFFCERVCLDC